MWRSCARSRAAAFSLSLVLFFWFGWEIHQSVSHTLALLAAVLALFIAALAYAERPTAARAFLLGLIIGLGLMAKWSFLLVLLSLAAALAITPETRRMYREPRTLLVLAGAALPILPFGLWFATIDSDLVGRRTMPPGRALSLDQALQGLAAFLTGIPLVFLPWIALDEMEAIDGEKMSGCRRRAAMLELVDAATGDCGSGRQQGSNQSASHMNGKTAWLQCTRWRLVHTPATVIVEALPSPPNRHYKEFIWRISFSQGRLIEGGMGCSVVAIEQRH